MKYIPSLLVYFMQERTTKRNIILLSKFFLTLAIIVGIFSVIFHVIMLYEGRDYSWITGIYWTLTVMSTLGFGDITFSTDLGLIFSLIVLLSGILLLLIMLPFSFIRFFYAPWLSAQAKARTPHELPEGTTEHIIITNIDPLTINLIGKLELYGFKYAVVAGEMQQAIEYFDRGYKVIHGDLGDPKTYERMQVGNAAMVVVTNDDMMNTNISFTVRGVCQHVPIVTNADNDHSIDILEFAGSTHVFPFMKMLGTSLGRRTLGVSMGTNIIGRFDQLLIAEAPAMRTPLEGKTLAEVKLREMTGVTVVGGWERGVFGIPHADTTITSSMVLVLAGSEEQLKKYDDYYCIDCEFGKPKASVLILGGGRVGHAAAEALEEHDIAYKVVDKSTVVVKGKDSYIHGNAAERGVLEQAGISEARSVIITTHNDAVNIYLTIYCRQLRPDIQIISRATQERNVSKLHRAGADLVMSYASMGANVIMNLLNPNGVLTIAEELSVFRVPIHPSITGKTLQQSMIREKTECSVIAINRDGIPIFSPDPQMELLEEDELIIVGTGHAEKSFKELY
ncbi:MAG: NAD-binding protein [Desulfobulbaceae bacterium]|nr:NAD-binding protein [Desulfobulbaceae bacterium]